MPGKTLREAIAIALESVPSVELASGPAATRRVLHDFLLGWMKDYAYARGVILEDHNIETELREVIAELRGGRAAAAPPAPAAPAAAEPVDPLAIKCRACCAMPGERCASLQTNTPREPHAWRIEDARKGTP
jgi:hypothetical protein